MTTSTPQTQTAPDNPSPATNTTTPNKEGCFIATAAYDSKYHSDVETFRAFRDQIILKYIAGKYLVSVYYWVGPYLAKLVSSYIPIKKLVRSNLERLAQWIRVKKIM